MSNVLIGIIGVVLFIGLALAGALFLGPRFQDAANNSRASAMMQITQQIANAMQMRAVSTGDAGKAGRASNLAADGYLKTSPANPVETGWLTTTSDANGLLIDVPEYGIAAMYDWPSDPSKDANRSAICAAVARQAGQQLRADGGPPYASAPTSARSGCVKLDRPWGENTKGLYIVWTRI